MELRPDPALDRLRIMPLRVGGSHGAGERRARGTGAGMEFADYRAYQPGDDPRHIDPQLYLRSGQLHLRQFAASKQLMVVICLDATGSMAFGEGEKFVFAQQLAAALAQAVLMGGDALRLCAVTAGGLVQAPLYLRRSDVVPALDFIAGLAAGGAGDLPATLGRAAQDWPREALVILASDFWHEDNAALIRDLAREGRELWLAQILSAAERSPALTAEGRVQIVDSETGEEVILPAAALREYQKALAAWNATLARDAAALGGQVQAFAPDDTPLTRLLHAGWLA